MAAHLVVGPHTDSLVRATTTPDRQLRDRIGGGIR